MVEARDLVAGVRVGSSNIKQPVPAQPVLKVQHHRVGGNFTVIVPDEIDSAIETVVLPMEIPQSQLGIADLPAAVQKQVSGLTFAESGGAVKAPSGDGVLNQVDRGGHGIGTVFRTGSTHDLNVVQVL